MAWYGDNPFEIYAEVNRALGQYWYAFVAMMVCNVLTPQLMWFKSIRTNVKALFVVSLIVQLGMWTERFVIVVQSLHRDFMPSAWHMYAPTIWDLSILFGSMGFFMVLFLLFVRTLPVIAVSELRELIHKSGHLPGDES